MNLQEKSIPELVVLIENWMLALGGMHSPWFVKYVASRIKEAEAILQDKRKHLSAMQEAEEINDEDIEAASEMFTSLKDGDFYEKHERALEWLKGKSNERHK